MRHVAARPHASVRLLSRGRAFCFVSWTRQNVTCAPVNMAHEIRAHRAWQALIFCFTLSYPSSAHAGTPGRSRRRSCTVSTARASRSQLRSMNTHTSSPSSDAAVQLFCRAVMSGTMGGSPVGRQLIRWALCFASTCMCVYVYAYVYVYVSGLRHV